MTASSSAALALLGEPREQPLTENEAMFGTLVWVLSVVVAGRVWRWGSEECAPVTAAGLTLLIPGGLRINPEQNADIVRLDGSSMSISADGLFPPEDLSALIEAGHEFDDVPAEVALWPEGRAWDERMIVLRGTTALPDYGTQDEAIALTVESPEYEDQGVLVEPSGRVGVDQLGEKGQDKNEGRLYPLVFGRPDWVPVTVYGILANKHAVVAQGRVSCTELAIARIDPNGASTIATEDPEPVDHVRDSFGHLVARADYAAGLGLGLFDEDMEAVGRWNHPTTVGGGILDDHRDGYVTGLGDVVRWAMRRSTVPIDEGRWRAIEDHLNRWLIDFWTNDVRLRPWEFVRDHLLPLVPVSILHGPRGLYPVWWPYQPDGGSQARVAEVDVQATGLERRGRVQFERRDRPVNEVSIEYYPWQGDLWRYHATFAGAPPDDLTAVDTRRTSSSVLRAAFLRQGSIRRAAPVMQSRACYQRETAEQTLNWKQYQLSRAMRKVTYDDIRGRWAWLRPGSVTQLVDDELGINRLAWVRQRAWSVNSVRLQFLLWEHDGEGS